MKFLLKVTAVVTLFFFTGTSMSGAESLRGAVPLSDNANFKLPAKIKIPKKLGVLESSHLLSRTDKPLILYIQDAHAVADAQENIQKLIAHFQSVFHIDHILLEGLAGKIDPTLLRAFPDKFIQGKILRDYFERGEMTGAEMAAVLNPEAAHYEGLEDWDHYEKNYQAYLETVAYKPAFDSEIQSRQKELEILMARFYSPAQKELHGAVENFNADAGYFPELIRYLTRFPEIWKRYAHLSALIETLSLENQNGEKNVEAEVEKIAEAFLKQRARLTSFQQREFQEKFQAFRTRQLDAGIFLQDLIDWGAPLGMKPRLTPGLEARLKRNEILLKLQSGILFEEMEALIRELEDTAAKTEESKHLLEKTRDLRLLKKLGSLELTKKQWEETARKRESLGLNQLLWAPAVRFYELALKRDEAFHRNLESFLSGKKLKAVIVVAGGFHSQGFKSFLRENQYPYAVVTPAMRSLAGKEKYEMLMLGDVSWGSEIQTSLYDGFMRHASARLASALNPLERLAQIKFWRDEILRGLAKQGRIGQAGNYTKYLEKEQTPEAVQKTVREVMERYKTRTLHSVWKTFESQFLEFSTGLDQLRQTKRLNVENVNALLRQTEVSLPSMLSPTLAKFDPLHKGGFIKAQRVVSVSGLPEAAARAEARKPKTNNISREEFLQFIEGGKAGDEPTGDIAHLGSVGQRLRESLQYLLMHSHHYRYSGEEEMWADLLDILWEKRASFRAHLMEELSVNHYVEVSVKHALISRYRKIRKSEKMMRTGGDPEKSNLDEILEDNSLRPDQKAVAAEHGIFVTSALKHLEPKDAHLIHMHFWEQMSYAEIARYLEMDREKVQRDFHKAMEALKPWLPHEDWIEEKPFESKVPPDDLRALNKALLELKSGNDEKTNELHRILFLYRGGSNYAQIAEDTGVPLGSVKRIIFNAQKRLAQENPRLPVLLTEVRKEHGGQAMRRSEVRVSKTFKLWDKSQMRELIRTFQDEKRAYLHDAFGLEGEVHLDADFLPWPETVKKIPDRIFIYDPMGQLLEKRSLASIFTAPEKYIDLIKKPAGELKSPFEKQVESFQQLLQGLIHPFLEEMGLEYRSGQIHLSFEKKFDADGLPLFYLQFKLLETGPRLTDKDFSRIPEPERAAFKKAFKHWYPYFYVLNGINLRVQDKTAARDEHIGNQYPAQKLSFYAAALERMGEASHTIYQAKDPKDFSRVVSEVTEYIKKAEADLRKAFPDKSPDFVPLALRLQELRVLRENSRQMVEILISKYHGGSRAEARSDEPRGTLSQVLALLLPTPEEIVQRRRTDLLRQEARGKLMDLGTRFDRLEKMVERTKSLPEITSEAKRVFGPWASSVDITGLAQAVTEASAQRQLRINPKIISNVQALLSRPELLQKYFKKAFEETDAVALESDLLFALSENPEEIRMTLREEFQWAGVFYFKKSPLEKSVLQLVRQDGEHFSAIPHEGEKSVRSRRLQPEGKTPLLWAPANLLDFSGDKDLAAQFKARGFQLENDTLQMLTALKLSLKESLMLLKLFSTSDLLRRGLPQTNDGFRVLTGQGLQTGLDALADIWTREMEAGQQVSRAA